MIKLIETTRAASEAHHLSETLKAELEQLSPDQLGLMYYAAVSGHFSDDITVLILTIEKTDKMIEAKVAILYTEIEPAYCCPMIPMEHNGMCEMRIIINRQTAVATFVFID